MTSTAEPGLRDSHITIRLRSVRDLFEPPECDPLASSPLRFRSGIEELVNELGPRRLGSVKSVVIVLPPSQLEPDLERQLKDAIAAYCEERLSETDNDLRAFRQDGWRALGVGAILFFAGLAVSTVVIKSSASGWLKTFFGDGLAVVIAWIGAWYPLDTLINYTRPYRRTRKLLRALSQIEINVRAG
jgi:hypothetical protein